jgi:hypothetical protein
MKHLLLTTIAAVVLVGRGESQQTATSSEAKPTELTAGADAKPETPKSEAPSRFICSWLFLKKVISCPPASTQFYRF